MGDVLDVCCGTRMMWFDKADSRAVFVDKRSESFRPTGVKFADKDVEVRPDYQADFKALPFPDESFSLVVFDPPHIVRQSLLGNVTKYYGALPADWESELRGGFAECFRVLRPGGTLIFKWCESEIPLKDILSLTQEKPLFGHRSGRAAKTHWVAFMKNAHATAAKDAEVEALRAEVEMLRDAFSDEDMTAGAHWFGRYVEQKRRAERLAEALRYAVKQVPELATVPGIAAALEQKE